MIKAKKVRTILLSTCLALGLSSSISFAAESAVYHVVGGDSLYKISRVFGTTVDNLMNDNHLTGYSLDIGQLLTVPCATYTVQKGDTLFLIAQKYKISLDLLQRANNIYTDYLDIGQVLVLPGQAAAVTDVTQTVASTSESAYSAADIDLLARLIHAEAQGEPYEAKVAVGAVVVNRMNSGLFPTTIKEVIYQNINGYYQFTPVVNGWIDKPAGEESVKAAKAALNGADPSNKALFYYDNGTTNQWILSKPVAARIGTLVFAY